jgi:hypothetical protein
MQQGYKGRVIFKLLIKQGGEIFHAAIIPLRVLLSIPAIATNIQSTSASLFRFRQQVANFKVGIAQLPLVQNETNNAAIHSGYKEHHIDFIHYFTDHTKHLY